MNKHLLQRRQLLWYFGLGVLGTGAAGALLRYEIALPDRAIALSPPPAATLPPLPAQMQLPEFQGISQWLNSEPLTVSDLKGSVVLIQFWTFACINCQRTLPYITRWHQQYAAQGLKVIGIHTPEFAFEREVGNIEAALADHQIKYPVPIDNEFTTWRAYSNRFWPHLFLADRDGMIRYDHIGEGAYDQTEQTIRQLLA
ncbi:thioredoxin family protein [Leptolyngbya sp. BC1307]|uniref:thioredoxin family protein n=1 Tax=Leptolyngbya sp. BC1307 TaxID=2029589 RepID=UPI000EFB1E37|nr:thioredoxin family protein [Leptolyngbya sp. BC1307]